MRLGRNAVILGAAERGVHSHHCEQFEVLMNWRLRPLNHLKALAEGFGPVAVNPKRNHVEDALRALPKSILTGILTSSLISPQIP